MTNKKLKKNTKEDTKEQLTKGSTVSNKVNSSVVNTTKADSKEASPVTRKKMGRPEEWTEEKAIAYGEGLVKWLRDNPEEKYVIGYVVETGYYKDVLNYLSRKFQTFSALLKEAYNIQEYRLLKTVGQGEIKSIFVLKNHHGYADKTEVKQESIVYNGSLSDLASKSVDDLNDMLMNLTSKPAKGQ